MSSRLLLLFFAPILWLWASGCAGMSSPLMEERAAYKSADSAGVAFQGLPPGSAEDAEIVAESPPAPKTKTSMEHSSAEVSFNARPASTGPQRLMAYTATLTVQVGDAKKALEETLAFTKELGGYVAWRRDNTLALRIPADKYEETFMRFEALGAIVSRQEQAEDVTDQVVDLRAKLKAARGLYDRLLALLEKAETVKDTLAIEEQVQRVEAEVESLGARLKNLELRVTHSSVTVTFQQVMERGAGIGQSPALPFAWIRNLRVERLFEN